MQRKAKPQKPKATPLTQARLKSLLHYNPQTGVFTWRIPRGRSAKGMQAGWFSDRGYRYIDIDLKSYRAGRLAFFYMKGKWPPEGRFVDHINRCRGDDRWSNLRLATHQENCRNRGITARNKSGKIGVHRGRNPGTWTAAITIDRKYKKLGTFQCIDDAIAERCKAEKHYFGEFASDQRVEARNAA